MKPCRVLSLILLLLLIFYMRGYSLMLRAGLWLHRNEVRRELRHRPENKKLWLIRIAASDTFYIHWEEPGKELKYQGEMYDVVRVVSQGDIVHYYCLRDKQETRLRIADGQLSEQADEDTGFILKNLLKLCFYDYLAHHNPALFQGVFILHQYCHSAVRLHSFYFEDVLVPPERPLIC